MESVNCELSGYRWECPICETWNDIPTPAETDYCSYCGREIKLVYKDNKLTVNEIVNNLRNVNSK